MIPLDSAILKVRRFRDTNPNYKEGKPCLYVGMTCRSPEERFTQHKNGYKACHYVRRFGKHLRKGLYEKYNPLTRKEAEVLERELAKSLREKGYAVWQN